MHFDVVLYAFIHPCTKKEAEKSSIQYSRRVDAESVCVRFRCVCVCALQMCLCACASDVCVCASDVCVCVRFRCVCACASDVCVCVRFRCVRGKLLTQPSTVTPTIPSVFYTRLVSSGSPYIES